MKDRRQINLREYFSYLEMLIEKEKLNLYDVVEIEYLIWIGYTKLDRKNKGL